MDLREALGASVRHRYRVTGEIARGGAAVVFRGEPIDGGSPVAIKLLYPDLAWGAAGRRFIREMTILQEFRHPGILPLVAAGLAEVAPGATVPWFAMPFWEGPTLRAVLDSTRPVPLAEAVAWLRGVARALAYAHERDIIHRDLKPANVLVRGGDVVLADFGVARAVAKAGSMELTSAGVIVGTPAYMSPEQAAGAADIDGRSDLYGLGLLAYEMLTGDPPFTGATPQALLSRQLTEAPLSPRILRPEVPEALERLVLRWLAKRPEDRGRTEEAVAGLESLHRGAT